MKRLIQLLIMLIPLGASAQLILETESSWNGSQYVHPFGETNTATYGQTFWTDGSNLTLGSIQFHLDHYSGADDIDFTVHVAKWDDLLNRATGPLLYTSGQQTLSAGADWTTFTVNTGGTQLEANEQYVFFYSASNFFDGVQGLSYAGATSGATYAGGDFVFMNNGSNFDALFGGSWTTWTSYDLAFKLDFVPVPEPSTVGMLSMGALGTILFLRRRLAKNSRK